MQRDDLPSDLVINDLRGAVVGPVSLTIAAGTCTVIQGPSGAGKSLLLRMIADLDASSGEVRLGTLARATVAAPDWRRRVMHVAAEAGWWAETVGAHMPADTHAAATAMAGRLGLPADHLARPVARLSTGERQRLALVRALVRRPAALLLDEPCAALDPASTGRVEELLRERLADGLVLVVVTHDAEQARRLGTTRYTMQAGRLEAA